MATISRRSSKVSPRSSSRRLPRLVQVQRGKRGLRGPKLVRRITVETGEERLELVRDGSEVRVTARRARVSGGIVLKTEVMDIDGWTAALTQMLEAEAARNEQTRQALSRLLLDNLERKVLQDGISQA